MENLLSRPDYAQYRITAPAAIAAELEGLIERRVRAELTFPDGRGFLTVFVSKPAGGLLRFDAPAAPDLSQRLQRPGHGALLTCSDEGIPYQMPADSAVLAKGGREVALPMPSILLRVQRREAYRVHPRSPYAAQLRLEGIGARAVMLFDISAGGLSVVLPAHEVAAVDRALGSRLATSAQLMLRFQAEELTLRVHLEPRNRVRVDAPRSGYVRLGFALRFAEPRDRQTLQRFVLRLDQERARNRVRT